MGEDQERADRRLEEVLDRNEVADPRELCRSHLRRLKTRDPDGYEEAVRHYREELVPSIEGGEVDPLEAWHAYGVRLAELLASGRTVEIDSSGRARPFTPPAPPDRMVLHLPDATSERALAVILPVEESPAQGATYDLLVRGKRERR